MKQKITKVLGDITVEIEYENTKEAWAALATAQEAFRMEPCGLCNGMNVYRRVRGSGKYTFYELVCQRCGGVLQFTSKKGDEDRLFPRRRDYDKEGHPAIGKNGWAKYEPMREDDGDVPPEPDEPWDGEVVVEGVSEDDEEGFNPFEGEAEDDPLDYLTNLLSPTALEALRRNCREKNVSLSDLILSAKQAGIHEAEAFKQHVREYFRTAANR